MPVPFVIVFRTVQRSGNHGTALLDSIQFDDICSICVFGENDRRLMRFLLLTGRQQQKYRN